MLNFKEATFQNFLVFGKKQTITFDGTGVRYIYGENKDIIASDPEANDIDERDVSSGSGKSTLTIGLLWGVYGEVKKKNKIPLTRIANKKYKKDVEVTVKLDIDGKDLYWIKRYRNFKPHGNSVYLYKWDKKKKDWEDLSRADSNETQEKINSIVGINYNTAMKAILFSRDDVQDFLDMPIADRFKIFENIIQLNKFKEKYEKVYKLKLETEKQLAKIDLDISAENKAITLIEDYAKNEKQSLYASIENNKQDIEKLKARLAEIGSVENVELDVNSLVDIYKQQLLRASEFLATKRDIELFTIAKTKALFEKEKTETLIETYQREYDKQPTRCHACNEIQNADHYNSHKKEVDGFLKTHKDNVAKFQNDINSAENKIDEAEIIAAKIKNDITDLANKEKKITLNKAVKKVIFDEIKQGKQVALQAEINQIVSDIEKLKQFKPDFSRAINYTKDLRKGKISLRKLLDVKKEKQKILSICLVWMKVLDVREETSIKQTIISKIIPAFNSILQLTLDEIYNGLIRITFDTFLNEVIIYEGEEAQISELSTGERARINLCINLAAFELTRINLNASNAIFMDEVFNSMDVYSINKFIKLIKSKYAKNCLIHIVSHSKGVEENLEADQIIKIQRENRESKIIFV